MWISFRDGSAAIKSLVNARLLCVLCLLLSAVLPPYAEAHRLPDRGGSIRYTTYHHKHYRYLAHKDHNHYQYFAHNAACPPSYHLCDQFCFPVGLPLACYWPKPAIGSLFGPTDENAPDSP
jgi:hypothetical protein